MTCGILNPKIMIGFKSLVLELKSVPLKRIVNTVVFYYFIYYPFKWNTLYLGTFSLLATHKDK